MAVRLNVVMVQNGSAGGAAQKLTEAVVGELIGMPGIDLTLIDRLDQIDPNSTDQLTLDSISGDVAVLAWQPVVASLRALTAIGFKGTRARHAHDAQAPSGASVPDGSRRIYGYDLSEFDSQQPVCAGLKELLASRQIRTYGLDSLILNRAPIPEQAAIPEHPTGQPSGQPTPPAGPAAKPAGAPAPISEAARAPAEDPQPPGPRARQPLDLDDLVDQLDQLDP